MKKGFGWFFAVLGGLNIIRGVIMLWAVTMDTMAVGAIFWGIGFVVLGVWLINSSMKKSDKEQGS